MGNKIKLNKGGSTSKPGSNINKTSKTFKVQDIEGNKHVLKATVFSVSKSGTSQITEEIPQQFVMSSKIIKPPLNQAELSVLSEVSSELPQNLESMAVGIEGFGQRLIERKVSDEIKDKNKGTIEEEKIWLSTLLRFPNPEQSFTQLRKNTRFDLEQNGNAWWELVPGIGKNIKRYSCINKLPVGEMYFTKADKQFTRMGVNYVDENGNLKRKSFQKKFRRIIQIRQNRKMFFKEFRDPRIISRKDGKVLFQSFDRWEEANEQAKKDMDSQEYKLWLGKHGPRAWANEVYHYKLYAARTGPYGMPRYTGNIIAIKGSRSADETNIITQQNNHVPSMAILVSGAQLTEGSITRIKEFIDTSIKGDSNYSKFLLIEAESAHDGLSSPSAAKVEIQPLTSEQHTDQMWQEYDANNASKIRRSFRMPPIMVGDTKELSRATAQESERLAEKYVYNPARESMDEILNNQLQQQGFRFWTLKSNSPNVTNDEDIVKILTGGEKTGAVTPRIAKMMLEDVLNRELPEFKKDPDFDPDLPFSLSLAKLQMKQQRTATGGRAAANREGTSAPQGQNPRARNPVGRPSADAAQTSEKLHQQIFDVLDPHKKLNELFLSPDSTIEDLKKIRDGIEDELDKEVFGKERRDFFKHDH